MGRILESKARKGNLGRAASTLQGRQAWLGNPKIFSLTRKWALWVEIMSAGVDSTKSLEKGLQSQQIIPCSIS